MNYVDPIKSREGVTKVVNWLAKERLRNRPIFAIEVNGGV